MRVANPSRDGSDETASDRKMARDEATKRQIGMIAVIVLRRARIFPEWFQDRLRDSADTVWKRQRILWIFQNISRVLP